MADAKSDNHPDNSQRREPAKGGTKPAHDNAYPSGDSPKAQGDKLEHAVDEAASKKKIGYLFEEIATCSLPSPLVGEGVRAEAKPSEDGRGVGISTMR